MRLSDLSIKNPVFAVMLTAAMIVFGFLGYRDLGISQFPELDFPVVSITTYRDAASPEVMDYDVTDVLEDAVSGVEGIDYIQSQSLQGVCVVTVFFRLSRDIDAAMQDVQNAVAAAGGRLPNDIDPPVVSKVNFNKFPVMWLSIHGPKPLKDLNAFVDDHLKKVVQSIPGVGGVMYGGLRPRNMRIWLDRNKLNAQGLDAYDVWLALRDQHVEMPAGYVSGDTRELNVRFMGEAVTAEQFERLPIVQHDGKVVTLGELAVVEDGLADRRSFARFNGETNVGVGVMRATGANVVEVCDEVKRRLPVLRNMAPDGVEISISTDYSLFIKDDIREVQQALFLGVLLTAAVTFLFLGSIGTTLNVCVTIPASLIGTFVAVRWFGFTINFMTLLALSLSVGVVVDDAILVLENIYRRREHGDPKREAALRGAREITFAALAATLSIVAIFIPIAFMKGAIGRFFYQFGITVSVAVLLSLVVALTVTPMLCSLFLTVHRMRRPLPPRLRGVLGIPATLGSRLLWLADRWVLEPLLLRPMDRFMHGLAWLYGRVLRRALRHPIIVIGSSLLVAASAFVFVEGVSVPLPEWLAKQVGKERLTIKPIGRELVPTEDQNRFVVNVICPVGTNIDYVDEMLHRGEEILANLKDPVTGNDVAAGFFAAVAIRPGSLITEGTMFVRLIPANQRTLTQTDVMNEVRKAFGGLAGVRVVVLDLSTQGFTPARGFPVDFAVQGPDWAKAIDLAEAIRERLQRDDEVKLDEHGEPVLDEEGNEVILKGGARYLADVISDYRPGMPEVQLVPDRDKAGDRNVSIQRLAFALAVGTGGFRDGRYTVGQRRYDIRLRYLETQRESPDQLLDDRVKSADGRLIPLRDVVRRDVVSTLPVINRYNHMRKIEITANMAPGATQGEAIRRALEVAQQTREEMGLPESYRLVQLGNSMAMQETLGSMWECLALGFLIAYMILGVQFNSFVHPFTVLIAVPFGVTGALATLWATGNTLNMMSMIGMVLLAGLVKKNSIILVDYTNQLRKHGMPLKEALLTACPVRLRPIVMTSLATIVGAIPLAIGSGSGAETRAPLAQSIIGGSILATSITLVVVPVFYYEFDRLGALLCRLAQPTEKQEPPRHRDSEKTEELKPEALLPKLDVPAPALLSNPVRPL
jgi:multidrug efflux pump subunit AcrB